MSLVEQKPGGLPVPEKKELKDLIGRVLSNIPGTASFERRIRQELANAWSDFDRRVLADLESKGLLGVHQIESRISGQRAAYGDIKGEISGGFFLIMGRIDGKVEGKTREYSTLQFFLRLGEKDTLIMCEVPVNLVNFSIDPEAEVPTVEFDFNLGSFKEEAYLGPIRFTRKTYSHPNRYLDPQHLEGINLTISPETASKELSSLPLLPSPQNSLPTPKYENGSSH